MWRSTYQNKRKSIMCPACESLNTYIDHCKLKAELDTIRRQRICMDCGQRFKTVERIVGGQSQQAQKDKGTKTRTGM